MIGIGLVPVIFSAFIQSANASETNNVVAN